MQSSVRAVESYRRNRLIDGVTSDEDKVAEIYHLEEICQVLRNSPLDVVREMLEHTMKRLDHKSPIVKQKTLRFIKYASAKGGPEFKREMQRQAGVVRSLFHYRGQVDALKGDALNKAVRDTAHEAVAAIFGSEEKTTTMEDVGKRIQGFGNSIYERPREEEKKSVLSGLVDFGTQSIRQSIDMIASYNHYSGSAGNRTSLPGTYRSQGLRRSLTAERVKLDKEVEPWNLRDAEADDVRSTSSSNDQTSSKSGVSNDREGHKAGNGETVEDRLLDSLTTPGGVRLHPTRETLQAFTTTARKLDSVNLVNSFERKLKAHNWQVRFKALCLLEASLKERENQVLDSLSVMFEEDASAVVDCLQSPQASLRDKAKKVLNILGGGVKDGQAGDKEESENSSGVSKLKISDLPDLMDTRDLDFNYGIDNLQSEPIVSKMAEPATTASVVAPPPVQHDLLGDWLGEPTSEAPVKDSEADPFSGMSLHGADVPVGNGAEPDLFSGLQMDASKRVVNGALERPGWDDGTTLFDSLSGNQAEKAGDTQQSLVNRMESLSTSTGVPTSANNLHERVQQLPSSNHLPQSAIPLIPSSGFMNGLNVTNPLPAQVRGIGTPAGFSTGTPLAPQTFVLPSIGAQYVNGYPVGFAGPFSANAMHQQGFAPGAMNFAGGNPAFAHQQFMSGYAGMPRYGESMQTVNPNSGGLNQNYSDNLDFSGDPVPRYGILGENRRKEDTKAFDFISDHMSSQLGPKKSR